MSQVIKEQMNEKEPFIFHSGYKAFNPEDLIRECTLNSSEGIFFLKNGDFENWFNYIGRNDFAEIASNARLNSDPNGKFLDSFIREGELILGKDTAFSSLAKEELDKIHKKAASRGFAFLLIGRTGVGKSSTINSLMGRDVAPVGKFEPETKVVEAYTAPNNVFIPYIVYDTPGLADSDGDNEAYLRLIESKVNRPIDCLWFVTHLDDTRVRTDEIDTIRHATIAFGKEIWNSSVIVFTRADKVDAEEYELHLSERTRLVRKEIEKVTSKTVADAIPSVAVNNLKSINPNGKPWLGNLFAKTFVRISEEALDGFMIELVNWRGVKGFNSGEDKTNSFSERPNTVTINNTYSYEDNRTVINKNKNSSSDGKQSSSPPPPPPIEVFPEDKTPVFIDRANNWLGRIRKKVKNAAKTGSNIGRGIGSGIDKIAQNKNKEAENFGAGVGKVVGATVGAVDGLVEEGEKLVKNVFKGVMSLLS
ncbi:MAG: GTPase [Cyanobacteria bacterium P01_G01_bin.39]